MRFPSVDPIPLPAPIWLMKLLSHVTLALHFTAVMMLVGSLALIVWHVLRGRARRDGAGYEVGVSFLDPEDVFRARMVAQVCFIEDYRRSIARAEGRELSSEEAAGEWIAKYAHKFPGASGGLQ